MSGTIRFSGIGVFIAAIITFIQGCTQSEGLLALILFFILGLLGGGGEETTTSTPSPATVAEITMYSTAVTTDGNINGRAGADALCRLDGNRPSGHTDANVRAFIAVSATDEIRDMPGNYAVPITLPIKSLNGTTLSADWANLLDRNIDVTLNAAGVVATAWWSGAQTGDGDLFPTLDCTGWTSTVGNGIGGSHNVDTNGWMAGGAQACGSSLPILCLGY